MTDDDAITVSIEMGPGYRPTPRLAAAVEELEAALREAHGDEEVSGFGATEQFFTVEFGEGRVAAYTVNLNVTWNPTGGLTGTATRSSSQVIESVGTKYTLS